MTSGSGVRTADYGLLILEDRTQTIGFGLIGLDVSSYNLDPYLWVEESGRLARTSSTQKPNSSLNFLVNVL